MAAGGGSRRDRRLAGEGAVLGGYVRSRWGESEAAADDRYDAGQPKPGKTCTHFSVRVPRTPAQCQSTAEEKRCESRHRLHGRTAFDETAFSGRTLGWPPSARRTLRLGLPTLDSIRLHGGSRARRGGSSAGCGGPIRSTSGRRRRSGKHLLRGARLSGRLARGHRRRRRSSGRRRSRRRRRRRSRGRGRVRSRGLGSGNAGDVRAHGVPGFVADLEFQARAIGGHRYLGCESVGGIAGSLVLGRRRGVRGGGGGRRGSLAGARALLSDPSCGGLTRCRRLSGGFAGGAPARRRRIRRSLRRARPTGRCRVTR